MSEFVDKVARAMSEKSRKWIDEMGGPDSWIDIPTEFLARAAIAAMEPTPEMIEAGEKLLAHPDDYDAVEIWNAMRAAALADKT